MKKPRSWSQHLTGLALLITATLLLGLLSGQWVAVSLVALCGYSGWHLFNSIRLDRWLSDQQEEVPESLGIWSDIFYKINKLETLSKKQKKELRGTIGQFQDVTNAFPDASMVIDDRDGIEWFNDAAHTLLGLKTPSDPGQAVTNLIRDPDFADWLSVQDHINSNLEIESPLDPNIRLMVSAISYRAGQRLLIFRDITDIHNLENVRRDFVANVSHELRTPLTVLLGYLEILGDQVDENLAPAVKKMHKQAGQMHALLNDLLELSRLQDQEREDGEEPVDVPAMLVQVKELAEELSQGNHEVHFEVDDGLWIRGNTKNLESAVRNLVGNAIKYTPDGGQIHVRWSSSEQGPLLEVSDNGPGIPSRDIPRLTERFYRVGSDRSRQRGGTGLGLSIVKHVLNSHQARLSIESELGEGSTFSCHFPTERSCHPT